MKNRRLSLAVALASGLALMMLLLWSLSGARAQATNAPQAGTDVGGVLTESTTWDLAGSPYTLVADVIVTDGVTLTVEPGVVVRGQASTGLVVRGHLAASGTPPVTFTSLADSAPGQWRGLYFDGGSGYLRGVTVRYAGQSYNAVQSSVTVRNVLAGEVRIEDSQIVSGAHQVYTDYGLYVANSRVVVQNTTFAHNGNAAEDMPVRLEAGDLHRVQLAGNTFEANSSGRILVAGGSLAADAILVPQAGQEGFQVAGDLVVPAGVILTVEPGVTVMSTTGTQLVIQGHLQADGRLPITFTSAADSAPFQWQGLFFDGGTGYLRLVTVRYAGGSNLLLQNGITVRNVLAGEVRLEDSRIIDGYHPAYTDYGLYVANSQVTLYNTTIAGNGNASEDGGLYATGGSTVQVTRGAIRDNVGYGLRVADATVALTCTAVSGNQNDGIDLFGGSTGLSVHSSSIHDNAGLGLDNTTGVPVDARDNWWGHASGPYHPSLNPTGLGDEVSDDVWFSPWLPDLPECVAPRVFLPLVLRINRPPRP